MKKISGIALVFALAAALMTGCGCTNRDMNDGMISDPTTVSTVHTTAATMPSSDTAPIATTDPVVTTRPEPTTDTTDTTVDTTTETNTGSVEGTTGESVPGRARRSMR